MSELQLVDTVISVFVDNVISVSKHCTRIPIEDNSGVNFINQIWRNTA